MAIFLSILLATAVTWYFVAVAAPLRGIARYAPRDREEPLPLGPLPGLVPRALKDLAQRVKDHSLQEEELHAQLDAQRKLSSGVFDSLDSGLVLVETGLGIIFANGAFREWFSPRGEVRGRSLLEFCLNHEIAELKDEVTGGQTSEPRVLQMEVYLGGKRENRHFRVRATSAEVAGPPGRRGVLFGFEDVTRLHELETIRRDFVANASHELRTPLSILKGYLENLQDGAIDDREMAMRFLAIMEKHCDRLASIVKDLLTVSRMESYTFAPELEPIDLEDLIHSVEAQLQPLIRQNGVELRLDFEPQPFVLRVDRFSFDQIFFNLIENAIKHNAGIQLKLAIRARAERGTVLIDFSDNGIGIPREDQAFVFNRFYRVTRGRTGQTEGTGLGLSIVKHALESHGGEVSIDSKPGAGTTIRMRVPNALVTEVPAELAAVSA